MLEIFDKPALDCVAIDFGTTSCSVALDGNVLELDGESMIDSTISYDNVLIPSIKRAISNPKEILQWNLKSKVEDSLGYIQIGDSWKSVIEISSDLLCTLRHKTNKHLKKNIRNTVITVPARFDEYQRQCVIEAATLAGWNVVRVIAEPTAAFLSVQNCTDGIYCVYDLGGGTFDFTVLRKDLDVIQVLGTTGDTEIGLDYFDERFCDLGISIDQVKLKREMGKITDFSRCDGLIDRSINQSVRLLDKLQVKPNQLIVVGGGAYMDCIINTLQKLDIPMYIPPQPRLAVVKGASIHAKQLMDKNIHLLIDITPLSIGVESLHGMVEWVIEKNTPLPFAKSITFTNIHHNQTQIVFNVVQGEGIFAEDCRSLGRFKINVKPSLPNTVKVAVKFTINLNGMLHIECKNLNTAEMYNVEFSSGEGLTKSMINRMLENSMKNAILNDEHRRLCKMLIDIDIVLAKLNNNISNDTKQKRAEIKNTHDAMKFIEELESLHGRQVESELCEAITTSYL